ncbi:MAG: DUF4410 domain-containing protein [Deltaproteobacteria bacterium]|nr:MAG: DUF4410 domain-containing protein [Deltaproteobacteria bacterium]
MMLRTTMFAAALLGMFAGCGGPKRAPTPLAPAAGQRIGVIEFSLTGAQVNYDGQTEAFGLALAEAIAADLRERGLVAEAIPASGTPRGELIVRGRILRIDEGSRALRYFVSFGAGAASLGVDGEAVRPDGNRIGAFADERRSGWGMFGGSGENLLQRDLREVAEDVGEMVATGDHSLHR